MKEPRQGKYSRRLVSVLPWTILVFLLVLIIFGLGWGYYRLDTIREQDVAYETLKAIGRLKSDQIAAWRRDRIADARITAFSPFFAEAVKKYFRPPGDPPLGKEMGSRLALIASNEGYEDILITDIDGRLRFSLSNQPTELEPHMKELALRALSSWDALSGDCISIPNGLVYMDTAAPIVSEDGAAVGVLFLREDLEQTLFPLLATWPTPVLSAETMLVASEAGRARIITPLPSQHAAALSQSFPLSERSRIAVQAVLGARGLVEGVNYQGREVVADIAAIPGSDWLMIAMEEKTEVLKEAVARGRFISLIAGLLVGLSGIGVSLIFLLQRKNIYKKLFRTELDRAEALDLFRTTLYSIGDGVITTDAEGRVRHINNAAAGLTGWLEDEAMGRPINEVFHIVNEDSRAGVEDPVRRILREGIVVELANHTLLIARDGVERPIADSGAPIRSRKGEIAGVVLVFRDQTEQRRTQRAIERSEAFFHDLFEYLSVGVCVYEVIEGGKDFIIRDMNRAGQLNSKVELSVIKGKRILQVFPGAKDLGLLAALQDVWSDGRPRVLPIGHYEDARLSEWVENSVFRLPSGEVVAIYRDVTAQKVSEEELRSSLTQKEALLHEVHHRVKNNLQLVSSLLSLQSNQLKDEYDQEVFLESRQRVWAMAELHEQLYASENFASVDFSSYIRRLVANLAEAYDSKDRNIAVSFDLDGVRIDLDRAIACGLIVNELVTNALKHAFPAGEAGTVTVSCRRNGTEGGITLNVADDGCGLPVQPIPDGGHSLGLRLVEILVQQIGGTISMESKVGLAVRLQF